MGTVKAIETLGCVGAFIKTDVSNAASVQALVAGAVKCFGSLDIAFNNARVLPLTARLADHSEADFDKVLSVDRKSVFLCMTYPIQAMLRSNGGSYCQHGFGSGCGR
jgi:NAD(P)-dependent dehydrogenase (short-subunit alcohol dehydrogenase family)